MKPYFLIFTMVYCAQALAQEKGTLYVKGGEKIIVSHVKKLAKETSFYYNDSLNKSTKTSLPNWLIDSIVMNKFDISKISLSNNVAKIITPQTPVQQPTPVVNNEPTPTQPEATPTPTEKAKTKEKFHSFNYSFGITLGNFLELNNPNAEDKKGFSFASSLDLNYKYFKPNALINMSHELHYTVGLQRESLTGNSNLQKMQDELITLHDISIRIRKNSKWNINTIFNFNTGIFTTFDGDYFEDINNLGKVKGFLSPYTLSIAPGMKYDVNNALKVSLSPYSFELYGVKNDEISQKGIYITDTSDNGKFKKSIIRRQGFEMNIWFDKNIGDWLEMQYRISVTSDYKGSLENNTVMEGLFLTKAKIFKNIYLSHRATLNNNLSGNLLKPYFTQTIQLSFNKSL